jgi:DNA end-binding protein Ku
MAFVPIGDIDARYWDTPYIALPAKGAEHSYALLAQALGKSGRAGIAKYVMRQRQHLAALITVKGRLIVSTMRFQEDLVALPEAPSQQKLAARELELAKLLIEGMADRWEPEKYTDDYVAALMKVIEAKAEGETVRAPKIKPAESTKVVDLVARLRESLAATGKKGKPSARTHRSAPSRRRATKTTRRSGRTRPRVA